MPELRARRREDARFCVLCLPRGNFQLTECDLVQTLDQCTDMLYYLLKILIFKRFVNLDDTTIRLDRCHYGYLLILPGIAEKGRLMSLWLDTATMLLVGARYLPAELFRSGKAAWPPVPTGRGYELAPIYFSYPLHRSMNSGKTE